jgi:hypothetical protein
VGGGLPTSVPVVLPCNPWVTTAQPSIPSEVGPGGRTAAIFPCSPHGLAPILESAPARLPPPRNPQVFAIKAARHNPY